MRAAAERERRAKTIEDGRVYSLAQLVAYAVNDPRRMPKFDKVFPDGRLKRAMTPDEILAAMTEWADMVKTAEGHDG